MFLMVFTCFAHLQRSGQADFGGLRKWNAFLCVHSSNWRRLCLNSHWPVFPCWCRRVGAPWGISGCVSVGGSRVPLPRSLGTDSRVSRQPCVLVPDVSCPCHPSGFSLAALLWGLPGNHSFPALCNPVAWLPALGPFQKTSHFANQT